MSGSDPECRWGLKQYLLATGVTLLPQANQLQAERWAASRRWVISARRVSFSCHSAPCMFGERSHKFDGGPRSCQRHESVGTTSNGDMQASSPLLYAASLPAPHWPLPLPGAKHAASSPCEPRKRIMDHHVNWPPKLVPWNVRVSSHRPLLTQTGPTCDWRHTAATGQPTTS